MRITLKLTLAVFIAFTSVLTASGLTRIERERALFQDSLLRELTSLGRSTAAAMQITWLNEGEDAAMRVLEAVRRVEPHFEVSFVPPGDLQAALEDPSEETTLANGTEVVRVPKAPDMHQGSTVVDEPVRVGGRLIGAIEVSGLSRERDAYIADSIERTASVVVLTLLVCAGLVFALGALIIQRPINRLEAAARRIGGGDLRTPVTSKSHDELGDLGRSLDDMREGLVVSGQRLLEEARARAQADMKAEAERSLRMEAVEQLRHADRLASVGKLASSMAHELGAPLQVVLGRAKMIEREKGAAEATVHNARIVREQAERITTMMRQLLDFSRRRGTPHQNVLLAGAIRKCCALIEPIAGHARVQIVVDASDPALAVRIDDGHLQQVLLNLALNAIQAMPEGGTLTITALRAGPVAELCVADTGTGMSDEVLGRIFAPFFTTKPPGQGTGLGLVVTAGIAQDAGGRIDVESKAGSGSRFRVHLPVAT